MLKSSSSATSPLGLELVTASLRAAPDDVIRSASTRRASKLSRALCPGINHMGLTPPLLGLSCSNASTLGWAGGAMRSLRNGDVFVCEGYRRNEGGGGVTRKKKQYPPGVYEVINEETGEKVIVWGVEGDEPLKLTSKDLNWEPVENALPGDMSDEAWYRVREKPVKDQPRHSQERASVGGGKALDEKLVSPSSKTRGKLRLPLQRDKYANDGSLLDELRERRMVISKAKEDAPFKSNATYLETHDRGSPNETRHGTKKVPKTYEREESATYSPRLVDGFFSIKSFKDLGANTEVIQALSTMQINRPSEIQAIAFKTVLEGESCIVADQTGSGKTLAYLTPLIQRLKEEEQKGVSISAAKRPYILILAPTSELAVQIHNVCRSFSKGGCPIKSMVATGGFKWKTQVESLESGPNIVVTTPGRFLHHLEAGNLLLDYVKSVVLDEVDILFEEEDFSKAMLKIGELVSAGVQYVHVTATLPVDVYEDLLERYPGSIPLLGPSLHRTATGLEEVLVDCSGDDDDKSPDTAFLNKKEALLQLVEQSHAAKTIIFCNKIETCRKVENLLNRHDRTGKKMLVLPYHSALAQEARLENLNQFLHSEHDKSLFLICTDRASRGLDSVNVEHIILFDFPRDPSEYVRRVGRTARGAGGTGKVFVFVVGKQVSLARRIMLKNEKGHPIHSVPGET